MNINDCAQLIREVLRLCAFSVLPIPDPSPPFLIPSLPKVSKNIL